MNTTNMTDEQAKIVALHQHLETEFFILKDEDSAYIFEGDEDEARADFESEVEGTDDPPTDCNFIIYCQNNLTELELDDDYQVLTDEEADEKAKEYILDSLWAFTPNFLSSVTGVDEDVFVAIQNNNKCESNNDAILSLVDDEDELVEEAIRWDGRGHFMSSYDGCENEETVNGVTYFVYRQN
jgi:hypothetical protein